MIDEELDGAPLAEAAAAALAALDGALGTEPSTSIDSKRGGKSTSRNESAPEACITLRTTAGTLAPAEPCVLGDGDIALISFTSGTTGTPKAIPRSHGFLMAQHRAISPLLHSETPERDLVTFPVFTLINIANGQTSVLPNWKMSKLAKLSLGRVGRRIERQNV